MIGTAIVIGLLNRLFGDSSKYFIVSMFLGFLCIALSVAEALNMQYLETIG